MPAAEQRTTICTQAPTKVEAEVEGVEPRRITAGCIYVKDANKLGKDDGAYPCIWQRSTTDVVKRVGCCFKACFPDLA